MYVPPTLPIEEEIIEKVANIKPVVYVSIDEIKRSISKTNLRRALRWQVYSPVETR